MVIDVWLILINDIYRTYVNCVWKMEKTSCQNQNMKRLIRSPIRNKQTMEYLFMNRDIMNNIMNIRTC